MSDPELQPPTDLASLSAALVGQAAVAVCAKDRDGVYLAVNSHFERLFGVAAASVVGARDADLFAGERVALRRSAEEIVLARGEPHYFEEALDAAEGTRKLLTVCFALRRADGAIVGVGAVSTDVSENQRRIDEMTLAREAAERNNLALREALMEMERLATTDRLTGIGNRRRLDEAANFEMSRAERYRQPVSLMLLDIDHFKAINDRFGHGGGDAVLVEFAQRVGKLIRRADFLARWGGEEFVVLAPATRLGAATRLAEKLCRRLAATPFANVGVVTVSIGVAEFQPGEGLDAWIARADRALYVAKRGGRNTVVVDPLTAAARQSANGASVMQLVWSDAYLCGHPQIDAEHQHLFELANRLLDALAADAGQQEVLAIVDDILVAVITHFGNEEEIHREFDFPGSAGHAVEHGLIVERGRRLRDYVAKLALSPVDLLQFLVYELVTRHMFGADRAFARFIGGAGAENGE